MILFFDTPAFTKDNQYVYLTFPSMERYETDLFEK